MSIYQVFVISRAGSLIYDWESRSNETNEVERSFEYPMDLILEEIDQKAVVVFGEREGIRNRYYVTSVNGRPVSGTTFSIDDTKHNLMIYLADKEHFPIRLSFAPPSISTNEKIILSSTFHSLYTIAVQLSPVKKSSGIEVLETSQFRLCCLQSRTGVKIVVVTNATSSIQVDILLRKLYELYADFALKNPFYAVDMPIRCHKFDDGLKGLLEQYDKSTALTV